MISFIFILMVSAILINGILSWRQIHFLRQRKTQENSVVTNYNIAKLSVSLWEFTCTHTIFFLLIVSTIYLKSFFEITSSTLMFSLLLAIILLQAFASLPFQLYRIFVVESKYGFNRQTYSLFFIDFIKKLIISFFFMLFVFSIIFLFAKSNLIYWWLYTWLVLSMLGLLTDFLYPVFIAPLFNRFSLLRDDGLLKKIQQLTHIQTVYVVDSSRRTNHSNAYVTGFGKFKRVVLYDNLLSRCNTDEIIAILCHELGHVVYHHTLKFFILMTTLNLLAWLAFSELLLLEYGLNLGLMIALLLLPTLLFFVRPLLSVCSRKWEYDADQFAVSNHYGTALAEALKKLYAINASTLSSDKWFATWFDSHPQPADRLTYL